MWKGLHGFFETKVSTGSQPDEETDADEQRPLTLSEQAKTFLLFVAQHPDKMSSEVSRNLKLSTLGKQIREYLEAKGWIIVTKGRSATGRPAMFLRATEQGLKVLGLKLPGENDAVVTAMKEPDPNCTHHWTIEPAAGPLSRGKCKNCRGERKFKNWVGAPNNPIASPGI